MEKKVAPAGLSGAAVNLWHAITPDRLSPGRLAYLEQAVRLWDRLQQVQAELKSAELTTVTPKTGVKRLHPLVAVETDLRRDFLAIWEKLGLHRSVDDLMTDLRQGAKEDA